MGVFFLHPASAGLLKRDAEGRIDGSCLPAFFASEGF